MRLEAEVYVCLHGDLEERCNECDPRVIFVPLSAVHKVMRRYEQSERQAWSEVKLEREEKEEFQRICAREHGS